MSHARETVLSKPLMLSIGVLAARLSCTSGVKKASTPLRIRAQAKPITNSGEGRCSVLLTVWHAALGTFHMYMLVASESRGDQSGGLKGRRRGRSWDWPTIRAQRACCLVG